MNKRTGVGSKVLLLICLLVSTVAMLPAIIGRVQDSGGKAISGALISDKHRQVYSKADGSFSMQSEADSLYISRLGYQPLAVPQSGGYLTITMSTEEITLPTVRVKALEYKMITPALNADIIHPDTNAKVNNTASLLLENSVFSTSDIRLSGEKQTLSLLGSFSRHALVMLDGVVLNPAGEAFDFSSIPMGQIDYIDVIKGNSSVYGGSAAIGGIVHIHTKSAQHAKLPELQLSAALGSFGMQKESYALSYGRKHFALVGEYTSQQADNNFLYDTPEFWQVEQERKRVHNRKSSDGLYLKGSVFSGTVQTDYSFNAGTFTRQLPGTINFTGLYDSSQLEGDYQQHSLRSIGSFAKLSTEMLMWHNRDHSDYQNLGSSIPIAPGDYQQEQISSGVKAYGSYAIKDGKLGLSAEYGLLNYEFDNRLQHSKSTGKRNNQAVGATVQRSFFPLYAEYKLLGALRGDYSEDLLHGTWRLENELSLPFAEELKLGAYVGTAFSQPSLFDMFWIGDSETQGNPALKSEKSLGFSVYGELGSGFGKLKLAYYQNKVQDLIQWRQYYLNGVSWKPFNVGKAEMQNLEADGSLKWGRYLVLSGNITFTKAVDRSLNPDGSHSASYDKTLVYTPERKAVAKLKMGTDKQALSISYSHTGEQYSTPDNLIEPLPSFENVDVAGFWQMQLGGFKIQAEAKVNNILDKRYSIYAYTPQPGINWYTGLSIGTKNYK